MPEKVINFTEKNTQKEIKKQDLVGMTKSVRQNVGEMSQILSLGCHTAGRPATKNSILWDEVFHNVWRTLWKKKDELWIGFEKLIDRKRKFEFSRPCGKAMGKLGGRSGQLLSPVEKPLEKPPGQEKKRLKMRGSDDKELSTTTKL